MGARGTVFFIVYPWVLDGRGLIDWGYCFWTILHTTGNQRLEFKGRELAFFGLGVWDFCIFNLGLFWIFGAGA